MIQRSFPPRRLGRLLGLAIAVGVLCTPVALAQYQTGNIFGTVSDNQGVRLPGVTITLSGVGATQVFVSDDQGEFRFLNLDPGRYTLKADLAGFGTSTRTTDVNVGRNSSLEVTLNPAMEQTITVTAEAPLLDGPALATIVRNVTARARWISAARKFASPGIMHSLAQRP